VECKNTNGTGNGGTKDKRNLNKIPGKHDIKELQKTAILGTAHTHTHTHTSVNISVKVLNFVVRNYIRGTKIVIAERQQNYIP